MSENGKRRARSEKLSRLRRGYSPRVLDLFAGCGGLSLGFSTAGFEITAGLELDEYAAQTHAKNFFSDEDEISHHGKGRDIRETEPEELFLDRSGEDTVEKIDVIVGGPPCQSFARVGRAKLREIDENPEAFLDDSRSNLYLRYLDYVRKLEPLAIVVENVPDALNYGDHNIAEEIAEVLEDLGYSCRYTLLNSAFYGVPQMRERMFLIAYAEELGSSVKFPKPTHWLELPSGYHNSRSVALKLVRKGSLFENGGSQNGHFTEIPKASKDDLPRAITAQEALDDLPDITHHLEGNLTRGARRFNKLQTYPENVELNDYARLMRSWPEFESHDGIYDHRNAIRNLPRDYPIFRRMEAGDQYPEAHEKALNRFEEKLQEKRQEGHEIPEGSEEYEELKSSIVPPYDPSKFPNKWRKMEKDEPARTLTAHIGKDTYSHIHYDSDQARTISVREAARLQSFPDGFEFAGTMNPAFRQIGNAVPPLLAHAVALEVASALNVNATSIVSRFDLHA